MCLGVNREAKSIRPKTYRVFKKTYRARIPIECVRCVPLDFDITGISLEALKVPRRESRSEVNFELFFPWPPRGNRRAKSAPLDILTSSKLCPQSRGQSLVLVRPVLDGHAGTVRGR